MTDSKFRTMVKALVTFKGEVLIGKKEEDEEHPVGGEWHIPGGHLEEDEQVEEAVKREIEEETGLQVSVHNIVDVMSFSWNFDGENDSIQVYYHCEAESRDAEPKDDLEKVKWVKPSEIQEEVCQTDYEALSDRENLENFIEKLEKMPAF